MVKTPSSHRTPLTSVALSKFATQRLMQRWVASTIQGADWKTERKSLFHCKIWLAEWDGWARGKIDLCVTVSFYEQAKLLWHKTHDIYSQKCGINCYHPDFLMGTYFNFLVTIVPRLSHCQERGCRAAGRAWQEAVLGPGGSAMGTSILRQPWNGGSSLTSLWSSRVCPSTKVCLHYLLPRKQPPRHFTHFTVCYI